MASTAAQLVIHEPSAPAAPRSSTVPTGKRAADATKDVFKHVARLKYQDEDWKARDEALQRLQKLITDGALSCDGCSTIWMAVGTTVGTTTPVVSSTSKRSSARSPMDCSR